jgi:hypothetical protein
MPQLTPGQARVIDPVLTGIAQGFRQNELVGGLLFPTVSVGTRAGRVIAFGREDFMQYANLARAPGEATRRVQFGYASSPFALVDYSLEGALPIEVLQEGLASENGFSIDGARMAMAKAAAIMALRLELQQASLATTLGNYAASNRTTLSGTSQWSDLGTVSDPIAVVETAKDAIRAATGRQPNTMVMGARVMRWLRQHPKIIDRVKYTGRDVPTVELLAALFGLERVAVGNAITSNDAGTAFTDVWANHAVVAYTETSPLASMGTPTFGYTYNLGGYPVAEPAYYDRNSKSWYFPVTRAEAPVIAAQSAGYFIQNAVA